VLALAMGGSARVLGMESSIGRIEPGYKADIAFLDLRNVNFIPLNDVANQIVNCEDGSAVDSVMIGGRMVLENRRFLTLDYEKLRRAAQAAGRPPAAVPYVEARRLLSWYRSRAFWGSPDCR